MSDDAPPMSDRDRYYAYQKDYGYPHPEGLCCCCDELGMCSYCERAEEEAEADERNEAFARDPDEDDFPDMGVAG